MRILVAEARDPWAQEGAGAPVQALVGQLRARGHEVETVSLPGGTRDPVAGAAAWRLLELSSSNARPVDLLIATGFPAYFARHPRKVAWLIDETAPPAQLLDLDTRARGECRRIVSGAASTDDLVEQLLG